MEKKETQSAEQNTRDIFPDFLRRYEILLLLQIILLCGLMLAAVFFHPDHTRVLLAAMAVIFATIIIQVYLKFISPAKKLTRYIFFKQRKNADALEGTKKIPPEWKSWFNMIDWLFERLDNLEEKLDDKRLDQQIGTNLLRRFSWVFERNEALARELKAKNAALKKEIKLNQKANRELKRHSDHLDDLVKERAADLYKANKRLEAAIEEAQIQTQSAEKANMAKSQFLANVSHEVRTPLNSIIGFTELLPDTGLNDLQSDYIHTISKSSETLLALINDILDLSKIEAGELVLDPIDFSVELMAYDVCEMIRPTIGDKPVELSFQIGENVPAYVKGDATRVQQVLLNLAGNAVKFTGEGEILLSIDIIGHTGNRDLISFQVKDSGIGIPKDKQQMIFAPFQQADGSTTRKYGGTGLGLPISKKLAMAMDGDITVESDENTGSVFHFKAWFDRSAKGDSWKTMTQGFSGKQILIVDDNQNNLNILKNALQSAGIRVADLRNGMEVISTIERAIVTGNPFDCCIIDTRMPGMDGDEIARQIRSSKAPLVSKLPLIAASYSMERDPVLFAKAGFNQSIIKPVRREKLFEVLAEVLKGSGKPASRQVQAEAEKIMHSEKDSFNNIHVLVAEDQTDNQKLIKIMLENIGCDVTLADNGHAAVETFLSTPYYFDLVVMDIQMPEMDGFEAFDAIRKKGYRTPVIALTAHASKEHQQECLDAGMDGYLSKPIRKEALRAALNKYVHKNADEGN